jgi:hypothetical protein
MGTIEDSDDWEMRSSGEAAGSPDHLNDLSAQQIMLHRSFLRRTIIL